MRILYITQWFEPEPAFKGMEFARALAARGHEVEVATGFPNYPGGKLYPGYRLRLWQRECLGECVGEIVVHRLWLYPSHDRSGLGRALNYLSFFLSLLVFGLLRGRRYDVIYVYHPPITPALAATLFGWLWRIPFLVDIQDLWPDSVLATGMLPARMGRVLGAACRLVHASAARIVVQSRGIAERLRQRGVPVKRLEVIYNWSSYAAGGGEVSARTLPTGGITCVYGGNLGQAQALETVIAAAVIAAARVPGFQLHLFGDGIERARLEALVAGDGSGVVHCHGLVPRAAMDRVFDEADMLVLHLRDDPLFAITIPSKLQHYMACGKPVIAGLAGEAGALLSEAGAGLVCPPQDSAAMASAMIVMAGMTGDERRAMGERGRAFYAANMSFAAAIDRTVALIEAVWAGRKGGAA